MAWYDNILDTTKGNAQKLGNILAHPVDAVTNQLKQGALYKNRDALAALLRGDTAPIMAKLNEKSPANPMEAVNFGLGIAPLGITTWHGSPHSFESFDLNAPKTTGGGLNKHGVFTSTEKQVAERYANDFGKNGYLYKLDADVSNPLNLTANQYEKLQSIVSKIDANKKLNEFEQIDLENMLGPHGWTNDIHPIQAIKNAGFDSITKDKGRFGTAESELMVFDPNKIKILERNNKDYPYFKESIKEGYGKVIESPYGRISILSNNPHSPKTHSVTDFFVDESQRNKGYGQELLDEALRQYPTDIGAQVSSSPSAKAFYNKGFRLNSNPNANLNDILDEINNYSSAYMVK